MATNYDEPRDTMSLDQRLRALQSDLQQNLQQTRRRAGRIGVLMTLLVLLVAGYWAFMYWKASDVNADVAADMVYRRTLAYVNEAPPVLSKALKDRAPEVFDFAEAQVLQSPAVAAAYIRDTTLKQTQTVLDLSEPRINQTLIESIAHAKTATEKAGFDGKDPAQLDRMIDTIAQQVCTDLKSSFDKVYAEYDRQAQQAVAYLDKVAVGKDLDERQQHLRQVIISFLAVAEKRKAMP